MSLPQEFKRFAMKGNVVDLAELRRLRDGSRRASSCRSRRIAAC